MADAAPECKPSKSIFTVNFSQAKNPGRPQAIRAPHGAKIFEISWHSGKVHKLPHTILRGYCPCAGCQGHSGEISFQTGRNLELLEIQPVGNYALCLKWGDHHSSGIYSFEFLHQLGTLLEELGEEQLIKLGTLPRGQVIPAGSGEA